MFDLDSNPNFAITLLTQYSFDLDNRTASELINGWRQEYPAIWVCQGLIEALYQGRYKAVSVEQILSFWQRRGQALHHYNYEFERLICHTPQTLMPPVNFEPDDTQDEIPQPFGVAITQLSVSNSMALQTPSTSSNRVESAVRNSTNQRQIEQFTPIVNSSEFYTKLKAISQHNKPESEQNTGK